jgi:prevent-host-death family protein
VKRVTIGEFRNRASELIRRALGGETIVILDRDREVARVVPVTTRSDAGGLIGSLAGTVKVRGDTSGRSRLRTRGSTTPR